ncbi:MAG: MFS transporter [Eubacteriales bacterium]|nr:MFS transporter [Eubacteriales bacterium]
MSNEKKFFGYKAAIGAFLVIFVNLGACTTLGTFIATLSSYSEHSVGAVGQIGTVNTICNVVLSVVALKALGKIGAKNTMLISVIACALHMQFYTFVTPGANPQSLIFMYIAGGIASIAITFGTHAICSAVIADWFVEKRAQVTGMVLSGAGLGAAVWVFLAGQLFKVTDYKNCYRIFSVLVLVIGLFAVLFLIKTPGQMGQKPLGWDQTASNEAVELPGVSYREAMKSSAFKVLVVGLLFSTVGGTAYLSYAPTWWQMNGMTATSAATWNAVYLLLAGLLLLVAGNISGKLGTGGFIVYVCAAFILTFICMVLWPINGAVYLMVLTVIFAAAAYPVCASIPSFVGTAVFGPKEFGQISATLMIAVYIGQAAASPVMAALLSTSGGMGLAWKVFAGTTAVGMVLLLLALKMSPMKKKK